jgi:LysM repeat protein
MGPEGGAGTGEVSTAAGYPERGSTAPVEDHLSGSVAIHGSSVETDWLDRICPYLLSLDGTYRSTEPDPGHRCTAQDPPGTLPMAFQERFCLTERHVRCEMYKDAQSARSTALEREGIPAAQLQSARFRPAVRSVPLALGPSRDGRAGRGASRRSAIVAAIGIGLVAVVVFFVVLMLGGSGGPGAGPAASPSPAVASSPLPEPTARLTPSPQPTPDPTPAASSEPGASPATSVPPVAGSRLIEYEVQEGEALLKISQTFGVNRRAIIRANEGMADRKPYTQPGDIILVPVSAQLAAADIESAPGFVRYVE